MNLFRFRICFEKEFRSIGVQDTRVRVQTELIKDLVCQCRLLMIYTMQHKPK